MKTILVVIGLAVLGSGLWHWQSRLSGVAPVVNYAASSTVTAGVPRGTPSTTNAQWKQILLPAAYHVLREQGTEAPFSSPLDFETRPGTYVSAACGEPLFRSEQKYDSGTGWPSFWAPISPDVIRLVGDNSLFEARTEVRTAKCDSHLGHVFDDGPPPTGKRYCMNGVALRFIPDPTTTPHVK